MEPHSYGAEDIAQNVVRPLYCKRYLKGWNFALLMVVLASCTVVGASPSQGKGGSFTLTMDRVMTQAELSSTGVATLTPSQRAALDKWLNAYTGRVLRVGENQACRDWDQGSLESVSDGGAILSTLSGHVFDVDEMDRITTQLWLAPANILYHCSDKECTIINLDNDGETAGATLLK